MIIDLIKQYIKMSQIIFYFEKDSKIYRGFQNIYQATPVDGKMIPRNFIYTIHENVPVILVEHRDCLTPESEKQLDENGKFILESIKLSNVFYKCANFEKARAVTRINSQDFSKDGFYYDTETNSIKLKLDKNNNPILYICAKIAGDNVIHKVIYPGHKFHLDFEQTGFKVEPFDETDKEIYYHYDKNLRGKEWHDAVEAGIALSI